MARLRPVVLVWLLLAAVSLSLVAHAHLDAPPGTTFSGTFYYADDFYNYLASVEQAQRGVLLFRSKLAPPDQPAALVNLEWLLVGWLAALLGGDPVLAYRVFGLAALLALAWLVDRWLVRCGLPPQLRLVALLLVFTGGGLGGLLYATGILPGERALDLRTGAFPFVQALGNPHFVAGTALLLGGLSAFAAGRPWVGAALGVALGVVRPYDAVLLVLVEVVLVGLTSRVEEWPRRLLPPAVVALSLTYSLWLFTEVPGFGAFSSSAYARVAPARLDLMLALAPALLLAAMALPGFRAAGAPERAHQLRLAVWAAVAIAIAASRGLAFGLQFVVGIGVPLLSLAALGLARHGRRALTLAVPAMASTAVVATFLCTIPTPQSHPAAERRGVALALRQLCRPGDVVLAAPDVGLYAGALSPCWPLVSHAAAPGHHANAAAVQAFYSPATAPAQRAEFLRRACPDHLVLLPSLPAGWLGTDAYEPRLGARARNRALAVWSRTRESCDARPAADFR